MRAPPSALRVGDVPHGIDGRLLGEHHHGAARGNRGAAGGPAWAEGEERVGGGGGVMKGRLLLTVTLVLSGCSVDWQGWAGMKQQPKALPYRESEFFADERVM